MPDAFDDIGPEAWPEPTPERLRGRPAAGVSARSRARRGGRAASRQPGSARPVRSDVRGAIRSGRCRSRVGRPAGRGRHPGRQRRGRRRNLPVARRLGPRTGLARPGHLGGARVQAALGWHPTGHMGSGAGCGENAVAAEPGGPARRPRVRAGPTMDAHLSVRRGSVGLAMLYIREEAGCPRLPLGLQVPGRMATAAPCALDGAVSIVGQAAVPRAASRVPGPLGRPSRGNGRHHGNGRR
jgi:hypothetical protein